MKTTLEPRQEFLEHRPSKPGVESSSLSSPTSSGQSSDTPNISRSEGFERAANLSHAGFVTFSNYQAALEYFKALPMGYRATLRPLEAGIGWSVSFRLQPPASAIRPGA